LSAREVGGDRNCAGAFARLANAIQFCETSKLTNFHYYTNFVGFAKTHAALSRAYKVHLRVDRLAELEANVKWNFCRARPWKEQAIVTLVRASFGIS